MERRSHLARKLWDYLRAEASSISISALLTSIRALRHHQVTTRSPSTCIPGLEEPLDARRLREAAVFAGHAAASFGVGTYFSVRDPQSYSSLGLLQRLAPLLRSMRSAEENYASFTGLERDAVIAHGGDGFAGGAAAGEPRWFLSIDAASRAVVLSVRGTMSITDVVTDALGTSEDFAWGLAHAGVAEAARHIWVSIFPLIMHEMSIRPHPWRFVATGHSLGGATASLLVILAGHDEAFARFHRGRQIEAIVFAPPPSYRGPPLPAHVRIENWVYAWDAVSRLSLSSLRELGRACQVVAQEMPLMDRVRCASLSPSALARLATVVPRWSRTWSSERAHKGAALPSDAENDEENLLFIPGVIFSWNIPSSSQRETVPPTQSSSAEASSAEEAGEAANFGFGGSEEEPPSSPSSLARSYSFVGHAELVTDSERSSAGLAAVVTISRPSPTVPATALVTRIKCNDDDMCSLPLFAIRNHLPDYYLHGLRSLAAFAEDLEPSHDDGPSAGGRSPSTSDHHVSGGSKEG